MSKQTKRSLECQAVGHCYHVLEFLQSVKRMADPLARECRAIIVAHKRDLKRHATKGGK